MKLLYALLSTLFISSFANAYTFLNFIPFQNSDCSGKENGLGYSIVVDTCIQLSKYENNHRFTVSGNSVKWGLFQTIGDSQTCTQPISSGGAQLGSCVPFSTIGNLDTNYSYNETSDVPIFYKITTSDSPHIPTHSVTFSTMAKHCLKSHVLMVEYFSGNYSIAWLGEGKQSYYCEDGIPYQKQEGYPAVNLKMDCYHYNDFYNSSFELSPPDSATSSASINNKSPIHAATTGESPDSYKNNFDERFDLGDGTGFSGGSGSGGTGGLGPEGAYQSIYCKSIF